MTTARQRMGKAIAKGEEEEVEEEEVVVEVGESTRIETRGLLAYGSLLRVAAIKYEIRTNDNTGKK